MLVWIKSGDGFCYFYYPFFPLGSSHLSCPLAVLIVVALRSFMSDRASFMFNPGMVFGWSLITCSYKGEVQANQD